MMQRKRYKTEEAYKEARAVEKRRYYTAPDGYKPRTWSVYEDNVLTTSQLTARQLADKLGRSVKSIEYRRSVLRKRES